MKISELHVTGFRSLKDVVWRPGDLNVVIGANASGKSNLLRVLEMLAESANGRLEKYVQASGGIVPLLWDGQIDTINVITEWSPSLVNNHSNYTKYNLSIERAFDLNDYLIVEEILQVAGDLGNINDKTSRPLIHRTPNAARVYDDDEKPVNISMKKLSHHETILSVGDTPFTRSVALYVIKELSSGMKSYHALDVSRQSKSRQAVVTQFAERLDADTENFIAVLHTLYTRNSDFEEAINDGMSAAFDDFERLKFPPAAEQRIQLELKWKSLKKAQSAAYLSDGTLRFLMLLTILAHPEPPPLIAIDEPETGLHPGMFPVIADFAAEASRKTQVVFTTHSSQFLDALGDKMPTVTVAKWEDGETKLNVLDGEGLKYWLKEYSLGSLYETGELEAMR